MSESQELASLQAALAERYTLEREIGRGGMATVYLAEDVKHHRKVAVKAVRLGLSSENAQRFLREIEIAANLTHPHILPVHDSGEAEGVLYYVMPYVDGESLRVRLDREGQLPLDEALRITKEIADALTYAHGHGFVHRDIKPENILLSDDHAVVADFGLARALTLATDEHLTGSGVSVGTPTYMSPEQASGEQSVDERTDIYALACTLYEMLSGEVPFTGSSARAIIARKLAEKPLPVSVLRENVPPTVERAVARALARVPADRFKKVEQFVHELMREPAPPRGKTVLRVARVAVLSVAAAMAGWWIWNAFQPRPVLDPHKVVVYPPANRAGDDPGGEGVDLVIGMALEHAEPLRSVPPWNYLSPEQRTRAADLSRREYRDISRELRARYYITGQLLKRPDSISILLLLHDAEGDSTVQQSSASAALGIASYSDIAVDALRSLLPALVDPGRQVDLSLITDRAPEAITNWIYGERSYRLSRFPEALVFYRQALDADSLMAFAALKGAQAASWSHQPAQASELLEHALSLREDLPGRYQFFLDGLHAYLTGSPDMALANLDTALQGNPDWSEASTLMGEVHLHLLPHRVSMDSAKGHFLRAASDPGFTPPLIHLAEQALREGRVRDANRLRRQLAANDANSEALGWLETMSLCVERGPESVDFASIARSDLKRVYDVSMLLLPGALQSACARAGFEALLTSDAWSTAYSWVAAQAIQGLLIAEGEVDEATAFLTSLHESADQTSSPLLGSASTATLFLAVLNSAAGAEMPDLVARTAETARQLFGPDYERINRIFASWLLGIMHAQAGDTQTTQRLRDYLAAVAAQPDNPEASTAATLADALSARLHLLDGDTVAAIAGFDGLHSVASPAALQQDLSASLAPERLDLARLYLARREYKAAHDVAAAFDHPGSFIYLSFVAPSLEIRYEAAQKLGDRDLAERYGRRLRALGREVPNASAS